MQAQALGKVCSDSKNVTGQSNSRRIAVKSLISVHLSVLLLGTLVFAPATRLEVNCQSKICISLPYIAFTKPISTAPVKVNEYRVSRTRPGNIRILGSVTATLPKAFSDVLVAAKIYDYKDDVIETVTGSPLLPVTLPSQSNPFDLYASTTAFNNNVKRIEVVVLGWQVHPSQDTLPLTDVEIMPRGDLDNFFRIILRNNTIQTLFNVRGTAWALWQCSSIKQQIVTTVLKPGESAQFLAPIQEPGCQPLQVEDIHVAAQGVTTP